MELQLQEKIKRLEAFSKERDILEKELISTKAELTGIKRTLGNRFQRNYFQLLEFEYLSNL